MSDPYHYQHGAGNNPQYGGGYQQGYYPPQQQYSQQGYYPPAVSLSKHPFLFRLLTPSLAVLRPATELPCILRSSLLRSVVRTTASTRRTLRRNPRLLPELPPSRRSRPLPVPSAPTAPARLERFLLRRSVERKVLSDRTAANRPSRTGTGRREGPGIDVTGRCSWWFLG